MPIAPEEQARIEEIAAGAPAPAGTGVRGLRRWPRPHRPLAPGTGPARSAAAPVQGHHELEPDTAGGRKPAQPAVLADRAASGLGDRYHRHPDRPRVALSGRAPGPVDRRDRGRRDGRPDDPGTDGPCALPGGAAAAATRGADPPLGSRQPLRCPRLPRPLVDPFGLRASMSRQGNGYDNAPMESFWGSLKNELVHHRRFATRTEADSAIREVHRDLL